MLFKGITAFFHFRELRGVRSLHLSQVHFFISIRHPWPITEQASDVGSAVTNKRNETFHTQRPSVPLSSSTLLRVKAASCLTKEVNFFRLSICLFRNVSYKEKSTIWRKVTHSLRAEKLFTVQYCYIVISLSSWAESILFYCYCYIF